MAFRLFSKGILPYLIFAYECKYYQSPGYSVVTVSIALN